MRLILLLGALILVACDDSSAKRWSDLNFQTEVNARAACEKRGQVVIRLLRLVCADNLLSG